MPNPVMSPVLLEVTNFVMQCREGRVRKSKRKKKVKVKEKKDFERTKIQGKPWENCPDSVEKKKTTTTQYDNLNEIKSNF